MKLDATDLKILSILQQDGRITNAALSQQVGLSPAPTLERVRKLESSGLIESYHAIVNAEKLGYSIIVFIEVTLNYHSVNQIDSFISRVREVPEILEAYHITGQGDFLLKLYATSISDYQRFVIEKLSKIDGVGHIQSKVVLGTVVSKRSLPLPTEGRMMTSDN